MNLRILRYHLHRYILNPPQFGNFLAMLWGLMRWKITGRYFPPRKPLILMIEPTNFCNFNCPLCDRGAGKLNRPEGFMSPSQFESLIAAAGNNLKLALLWNQGEPLLNKNFTQMVRAAKKRGIFCVVSTNGSLLDKFARDIVDSGLDELIVSLDGAKAETFNLYRRGGDFRSIIEGVKKVVRLRSGKSTPLISLQFLLLKHNTAEIADFKKLAADIGADRVLWKTVQVANTEEAEEYLPQESRFSRYSDKKRLKLRRVRKGCWRILYSAVIDWNGNMVPCCFDKDENFLLGNVFTDGFDQVWRGEKFARFRARLAQGKPPAICSNCTEGLKRIFV